MKLTNQDYKDILLYYNIDIKNLSKKQLINKAENILANKLCRCIKKIDPQEKDLSKTISICNNSVLKKKGIKPNKFNCKKKPKFTSKRKYTSILGKNKKNLTLKKKNLFI